MPCVHGITKNSDEHDTLIAQTSGCREPRSVVCAAYESHVACPRGQGHVSHVTRAPSGHSSQVSGERCHTTGHSCHVSSISGVFQLSTACPCAPDHDLGAGSWRAPLALRPAGASSVRRRVGDVGVRGCGSSNWEVWDRPHDSDNHNATLDIRGRYRGEKSVIRITHRQRNRTTALHHMGRRDSRHATKTENQRRNTLRYRRGRPRTQNKCITRASIHTPIVQRACVCVCMRHAAVPLSARSGE